jgi:hypothetical protein
MTDVKHILYKIYYYEDCIYLGRTEQPIANRLRGHFFSKPMHRKIHLPSVSRIEVAECNSTADMYLYEVYYINLLKPPLNLDDKANDELSVELPELNFLEYKPKLYDKWLQQILYEQKNEDELIYARNIWKEKRDSMRNILRGDQWIEWLETNPRP